MSYKEIKGDLIDLAIKGEFEIITHGCNCFCLQGAGIAAQMADTFNTHEFLKEHISYKGDINKLGTIDYEYVRNTLCIINSYTQYRPGKNLDYGALRLCLRKINHMFEGKTIGLPQIGAGIAGGDWKIIKQIIQTELKDMNVTVVIYDKN